ncbi:MAG: hypothetical protein RR585_13445 [Coprobacillus sp.]
MLLRTRLAAVKVKDIRRIEIVRRFNLSGLESGDVDIVAYMIDQSGPFKNDIRVILDSFDNRKIELSDPSNIDLAVKALNEIMDDYKTQKNIMEGKYE